MFIIINVANGDRISRTYASVDEALGVLRELVVGEDPLDPRAFGVQEIDEAARHVGEPVLLPMAA